MEHKNTSKQLNQYIDTGDNEYTSEYSFSKEDIAEFEERRNKRLKGESKTYSWEDAKAIITGKKNL